jgi:hypothetical protein
MVMKLPQISPEIGGVQRRGIIEQEEAEVMVE